MLFSNIVRGKNNNLYLWGNLMAEENEMDPLEEYAAKVLKEENRYYQDVTVTRVNGNCPYGHREGDMFKVTTMNSDSICGSLLKNIFHSIGRVPI